MQRGADRRLGCQHGEQFPLEIKTRYDFQRALAHGIEPVAITDTPMEGFLVSEMRQGIEDRLRRPRRVARGGVVDRDMQREVVGVDAQLVQLIRADEQMERELFIAQIEAYDLRYELFGVLRQRELDGALDEVGGIKCFPLPALVRGKQRLVKQDVVPAWVSVSELLQVNAYELRIAGITPLRHHAIKPCPIDQLGWRHGFQKIQCVRLCLEVSPWPAVPAVGQVVPILAAHRRGVRFHPQGQIAHVRGQVGVGVRRGGHLPGQEIPCLGEHHGIGLCMKQAEVQLLGVMRRQGRSVIGGASGAEAEQVWGVGPAQTGHQVLFGVCHKLCFSREFLKRLGRGAVQHLPIHIETRSVARAIPATIRLIPAHQAAHMRTDRRHRM